MLANNIVKAKGVVLDGASAVIYKILNRLHLKGIANTWRSVVALWAEVAAKQGVKEALKQEIVLLTTDIVMWAHANRAMLVAVAVIALVVAIIYKVVTAKSAEQQAYEKTTKALEASTQAAEQAQQAVSDLTSA